MVPTVSANIVGNGNTLANTLTGNAGNSALNGSGNDVMSGVVGPIFAIQHSVQYFN